MMAWIKKYFEIPSETQNKRGLICISVDEEYEHNSIAFSSLYGKSDGFVFHLDMIAGSSYYFKYSNKQLKKELKGRLSFFKSISPDPIALRFATESTVKAIESDNSEHMLDILKIYDEFYILNDRLNLSWLVVERDKNTDGHIFRLPDYKTTEKKEMVVKFQQIAESLYVLYLLDHPEGLSFPQVKTKKELLKKIYNKICKSDLNENEVIPIDFYFIKNRLSIEISNIKNAYKNTGLHYIIYSNYIIEGPKGRKKSITLEESLIDKRTLLRRFVH